MRWKPVAMAIAVALSISRPGPARAQDGAPGPSTSAAPRPLGPSFPCPVPRDPLAQLICSSPELSNNDLRFVQAYQALRYKSDPAGQDALRQELITFTINVHARCGIPAHDSGLTADPAAIPCVKKEYENERDFLDSRLSGPAAEEAARPLPQHVALQADLKALGFLPPDSPIDGVYGPATRIAIKAWQRSRDNPITGFLGDADAKALEEQVAVASEFGGSSASGQAPATGGPWTMKMQPNYSAPGVWRLNSTTGVLSFCTNQSGTWKCLPVKP